ncbi:MAG: hypothetical protein H6636_07640 [Anaerolineales bacterium]|nr:hypothetical protein [Anaerolineales bacterium]
MKNLFLALLFLALAGCRAQTPTPTLTLTPLPTRTPSPTRTPTLVPTPLEPPVLPVDLSGVGILTPTVNLNDLTLYGYTYQRADGNRWVDGHGGANFPVDIALEGEPAWVVGAPMEGLGSIWAVVLTDGRVQGFILRDGITTEVQIDPGQLPVGMPPLLRMQRGVPSLIVPPVPSASPLTHPIVVQNEPTRLAFVDGNGDLVLWENQEIGRLPLNIPPDARLLQDEQHRLLVVSQATDVYPHGVLGDAIEAASLSLVQTTPTFQLLWTAPMPDSKVIEGLAPIWADLDGNGIREILVTVSDDTTGAQILLFNENGERIAAGPPIGRGFRWRHQIAVAPFDPSGKMLLADVLTPHLEPLVEFSEWIGDRLEVLTQLDAYTSHEIGTRNLDKALAGDFDGDGVAELVLPNLTFDQLAFIQYADGEATVVFEEDLNAKLLTNLAGVTLQDGTMMLATGLEGGVLRVWEP